MKEKETSPYVVEMRGITKIYPLVKALDNVDFSLRKGEIISLLGENGAGKSTLMKVLFGIVKPDKGDIYIRGQKCNIRSSKDAIQLGIGMVHQHFMLAPVLTVTENIIVGCEPSNGMGFDRKLAEKDVQKMIDKYHFGIRANAFVKDLSVGEQQRVEILKAIYRKATILILDEPTAVLTPQEVEELFKVLREMRNEGTSIIIITHKLKETLELADSISVLRDGKMVRSDVPVENATPESLAKMMVGRDIALNKIQRGKGSGRTRLSINDITYIKNQKEILGHVRFDLKAGEILGLAGIEGNGQSELIECLTGILKPDIFEAEKDGEPLSGSPREFLEKGIGHVPEDRMTMGLITELSIADNVILGYQKRFQKKGIFNLKKVHKYAAECIKNFLIKAPNENVKCSSLSGGNQQKVVIARVFNQNPDVIIVAQPTRGVDIGASEYIHEKLRELRDSGKAILLVSADLDEVKALSDNLMVIYDGKIVARGKTETFTDTQLGLLMTGAEEKKEESLNE